MGWKQFNDRLALVTLLVISAILSYLVYAEASMRDKVLILLGPWGTMVLQYYFRKKNSPETPK